MKKRKELEEIVYTHLRKINFELATLCDELTPHLDDFGREKLKVLFSQAMTNNLAAFHDEIKNCYPAEIIDK